ncbi:HAD-IG family 5'-nucleotidase [Bdellovibrionota bacterium FG-2]
MKLESRLERGVFCNRTLNFRAIKAIGYDMDYTLVQYRENEWEQRAYEYIKQQLMSRNWPVAHLKFDPQMVCRGLIIDTEQGNLVKANRFGFVKRVMHGTRLANFDEQRTLYSRTIVDLSDTRWVFLNTLFSLSEGCIYAQLVDLLDQRKIPEVLGYSDLYEQVRGILDHTHMEGSLKADIIADPERFVILDPEIPRALLDQHQAGKKLMLITNSEWFYTVAMMTYCFDRFLPGGTTWRDLFDVTIVGARKPKFFINQNPFFEVVDEAGHLLPVSTVGLKTKTAYFGGSASELEKHLGISGDEILYVGDHMFGDVHASKNVLRWRTALILRELEEEIRDCEAFREAESKLKALMNEKERIEAQVCQLRLEMQRLRSAGGAQAAEQAAADAAIQKQQAELRAVIDKLDHEISPLAQASTELRSPLWGLLMRTGNDKSHLAYQLERYADLYTSRVSNFLSVTPYAYLRSPRGSLPHDPI